MYPAHDPIFERLFNDLLVTALPSNAPLKTGNDVCYESVSKANLLNKHFASISSVPDDVLIKPLPPVNYITNLRIPPLIEPFAVYCLLTGLNSRKSKGFNNLPNQLLKSCSLSLATPFSLLSNFILATNRYPRSWKIASVIPLHKSGPKYDISNCRPIAILPSVSKVFEKIIQSFVRILRI